jgi:hypothetical protein
MKLVSSNDAGFVKDTIQNAIKHYRDKSDAAGTLDVLTQLKGIGPATASLLLAAHDPDNVVFFADEAFYWLCCNASKASIKYNLKEYKELNVRAQALARRLDVKAVDIERVAFVLMRESPSNAPARTARPPPAESPAPAESTGRKQPAKRKSSGDGPAAEVPVRRSKRGKQA